MVDKLVDSVDGGYWWLALAEVDGWLVEPDSLGVGCHRIDKSIATNHNNNNYKI